MVRYTIVIEDTALRMWNKAPVAYFETLKFSGATEDNWSRDSSVGITMGWISRVRFPTVQEFPLLDSIQTNSGAHPASYPMGTGYSFPGGKSGRDMKLPAHLLLVPRSRKLELNLYSPICLYGIMFN
jgi:hypothetical protein